MAKTHKQGGSDGVPKSRPIVGASKGHTTPLGELLSDLIEPVSRMNQDSQEAMSTEEVLRKITDTNKSLQGFQMSPQDSKQDLLLFSLVLFPEVLDHYASMPLSEQIWLSIRSTAICKLHTASSYISNSIGFYKHVNGSAGE